MGTTAFSRFNSCCNRSETSGNIIENERIEKEEEKEKEQENEQNEQNENNKLSGYNTHQKLVELKAYRFFINNLYSLMMINNSVETKEFYFIKKSWIRSWYKYTCYEQIRPMLIKNEINNELDFHKIIIDHKKELNFEGFIEKTKPDPIQFFEINNINTNIKENFYIFDSKILKKFIEIYDIADNNTDNKEDFSLKGEIGKGRIIFDVKEYILIMVLNTNWEIKQIMVIFANQNEHKQFLKNIYGRALTYISKELRKIVQKKKMVNYQKDEILFYDDRDFIKYEYINNNKNFKKYKDNKNSENIKDKDKDKNDKVNNLKNENDNKKNENDKENDLQTNINNENVNNENENIKNENEEIK